MKTLSDTSLPTRERELKRVCDFRAVPNVESLPTRERELKRAARNWVIQASRSLPTRERELKHGDARDEGQLRAVAPYTGA